MQNLLWLLDGQMGLLASVDGERTYNVPRPMSSAHEIEEHLRAEQEARKAEEGPTTVPMEWGRLDAAVRVLAIGGAQIWRLASVQ